MNDSAKFTTASRSLATNVNVTMPVQISLALEANVTFKRPLASVDPRVQNKVRRVGGGVGGLGATWTQAAEEVPTLRVPTSLPRQMQPFWRQSSTVCEYTRQTPSSRDVPR
jgi:hypothetical protein